MLEDVRVVVAGEQCVHGDRHYARIHRAEKAHRPVVAVVHEDQHALFALDADGAQRGAKAAHALGELAIGQAALVVDVDGPGGAPLIELQEMLREVEDVARRGDLGRIGHGDSPPRCLRHQAYTPPAPVGHSADRMQYSASAEAARRPSYLRWKSAVTRLPTLGYQN